jgi:transposase
VASLYKKVVNGKPYWYLREMAWVEGKPKLASERYLGTAAEIEALLEAREQAVTPQRTRHLAFGEVAAVWGMLQRLDVAGLIDEVVGPRRCDAGASVGTYLALAALNRVVAPCSKLAFAAWWKTTAADRFTKIGAGVLDHRRFWDAMRAVTPAQLAGIEQALALRIIERFELDISCLALDMTNFATFIDTGNPKAPIAQRGKAKQKRSDLRLVGLGLVVTRDGGIPLLSHAYPGNKPDVTQFPVMIDALRARHATLAAGVDASSQVTVVFDAGQNSVANFAHLAETGLHYIGSVPASDCPDLLAIPARRREKVDQQRFGQLSAYQTRREVYGTTRRAILTHSPELHAAQVRGFEGTTLAKACRQLDELAATLARGHTRRPRPAVEAEDPAVLFGGWRSPTRRGCRVLIV